MYTPKLREYNNYVSILQYKFILLDGEYRDC